MIVNNKFKKDILLSLVRTTTVGHIRDIKRLIVSISRARLGLYIVGRKSIFENCYELSSVFNILLKNKTNLAIVMNESYDQKNSERGKNEVVEFKNLEHFGFFYFLFLGNFVYEKSKVLFQNSLKNNNSVGIDNNNISIVSNNDVINLEEQEFEMIEEDNE
jgi:intron-binding protein aquarius